MDCWTHRPYTLSRTHTLEVGVGEGALGLAVFLFIAETATVWLNVDDDDGEDANDLEDAYD